MTRTSTRPRAAEGTYRVDPQCVRASHGSTDDNTSQRPVAALLTDAVSSLKPKMFCLGEFPLTEPVLDLAVALVVRDGDKPDNLFLPVTPVPVMNRVLCAHGRVGGLEQQTFAVAPNKRARLVVERNGVTRPTVVAASRLAGMRKDTRVTSSVEFIESLQSGYRSVNTGAFSVSPKLASRRPIRVHAPRRNTTTGCRWDTG